ncbi:MAG TPA: glycosyltransferase family 39 protein [Thermoanaerobaculia bacterium]|nr:glycosyltransferase family 39 protein [Thermoanaerobaculia bacterium]
MIGPPVDDPGAASGGDRGRPRRPGVGILLGLAAVLHVGLFVLEAWPAPRRLAGDELRYSAQAARLAAGQPVARDLLWPPGYPRFVAAAMTVGGESAVRALQWLLLLGCLVLVADLGRRLCAPGVGVEAALLLACYPPFVAFACYLWPEIPHLFLALAAVWLLAFRSRSLFWLATAGVALGLALLLKSLLTPFLPLLLAPLLGERSRRLSHRLSGALAVVAALGFTVAPVVWGNARSEGFFGIADSSVFNLWVGLEDTSRTAAGEDVALRELLRYRAAGETFAARQAAARGWIGERLRQRGPGAVAVGQLARQPFRLFDHGSFLGEQLPGGAFFARGWGYREIPQWAPPLLRAWSGAVYVALLLGGVAGLAVAFPWRGRWQRVALLFVAYHFLLFLALHVKTRYRVPLLPVAALYTAVAAEAIRRAGAGGIAASLREHPWRWAAGGVVAILVLVLAFAGGAVDAAAAAEPPAVE